ncbi:hypothetical protein [Stenotrophomonas maltophilia]|uniref:hypothetical protein n=1 Tax=Stenotrophomonas maltophilia TaxID=40324 RepID=UPI001F5488FB|nr:hypothetical protein [Stenotrophomonas maltophilia]
MAAPVWQPGTLYLPGDLVQPITQPPPNNPQVANGYFEDGATGWTFSGDAALSNTGGYGSARCVVLPGNKPDGVALNNTQLVVPVGGQLTANSMIQQGASVAGATAGWTEIRWYDALNTLLQTDKGNVVDSGSGGAWHQSTVTATAPASAAYARAAIHLTSVADHNHEIFGDNLVVSGASAGLPEGLVYKAVQAESGTSGSSEPAWPGILGQQVIDNEVIWEAVTTSRVTWTASPRYVSGATEPAWPTDIGAMVQDGTINWRAISRRVTDEKCPQSKVVAIVASKVFAADKDIVRFSATANPLDWSTADDAGYLPTGLQQANSNDMAVLQQYRSNLVALNASSFQNWQVDPDPASMAILDQMDGIGSIWPKAAVPVSNDLFYLSQLGVRTVGIANAAENLAAGDVGAPIDSLVQEAIRVASSNGSKVLATYYPGAGQYWLAVGEYPADGISVSGSLPDAMVGDSGTYQYLVRGGTLPRVVTISAGALPPGASISQSGLVTYTYTMKGSYSWTVRATDHDGSYYELPDSSVIGQENVWDSSLVFVNNTLSNANKTVTQTAGGVGSGNQISISSRSSGKWYFEIQGAGQFTNSPSGVFGVAPAGFSPSGGGLGSAVGHGAGMGSHSYGFMDGTTSPRMEDTTYYPGNRRCMVAFDADSGKLWFGVEGEWGGAGNPATGVNPFYTLPAGTYFPMVSLNQLAAAYTLITKQSEMLYQPPAGFSRWLQQ